MAASLAPLGSGKHTGLLRVLGWIVLALVLVLGGPAAHPAQPTPTGFPRQPVIYSSDLFHPHEDPDDHFDLATLHSIPGLDVRGIVLDQGERQKRSPGRIPISQLNHLTGRTFAVASGLGAKLRSPTDTGLDQPEEFQGGVQLILSTLRAATSRVDFIAVGSVRDLAAAVNREPALFRERAGRLLLFIGEASNTAFREYNVELDPHAFVGILRSGLDIHWVPCFDGGVWKNQGHASFWQATHRDLLQRAPAELIRYFAYALEKETGDPITCLRETLSPERRDRLFEMRRNLWCTAVFAALTRNPAAPAFGEPFEFEKVLIQVGDDGVVRYPESPGPETRRIRRFRVTDPVTYAERMTRSTADLLARFPIVAR